MSNGHFEAKKHAYRQTQDGIVVSFVIHPNDLDAAFAIAALGTRYMIAFAEIGDNEKPAELARAGVEYRPEPNNTAKPNADKAEPHDRKPFASLPLSQQAAIRCEDNDFQRFIIDIGDSLRVSRLGWTAADEVRTICRIESRSELDNQNNNLPRKLWCEIEAKYQSWLTDKRYAHLVRK